MDSIKNWIAYGFFSKQIGKILGAEIIYTKVSASLSR